MVVCMSTFSTLGIQMKISHIACFSYHAYANNVLEKIFPFPGTAAIIASPVVLTLCNIPGYGEISGEFLLGGWQV